MDYKTFLENIVNDSSEPTGWNHKSLLTFKDYTGSIEPKKDRSNKRIKTIRPKKQVLSKEISVPV